MGVGAGAIALSTGARYIIEYGDRYSQARTYHQLGMVAQELREYEQARSHYQQALDIIIEVGDRYSQSSTYYQLGKVLEETDRRWWITKHDTRVAKSGH